MNFIHGTSLIKNSPIPLNPFWLHYRTPCVFVPRKLLYNVVIPFQLFSSFDLTSIRRACDDISWWSGMVEKTDSTKQPNTNTNLLTRKTNKKSWSGRRKKHQHGPLNNSRFIYIAFFIYGENWRVMKCMFKLGPNQPITVTKNKTNRRNRQSFGSQRKMQLRLWVMAAFFFFRRWMNLSMELQNKQKVSFGNKVE